MGKQTISAAMKKGARIYTTEQMIEILKKNERFTIRKRSVKRRPKKDT